MRCDCESGDCLHEASQCTGTATHKDTDYGLRLCTPCAEGIRSAGYPVEVLHE